MHRLRLALLLPTLLAWTWPVHAATVAIVRPPSAAFDTNETLTRLQGELLSVGLEVVLCDRPAARGRVGADSVTWLEQVAGQHGASAVIDPIGEDTLVAVDVWVVKAHPRRFEVTRVAVEANTPNPSVRLALRAVEALRAGLLEVDWAARRRGDEPSARPSTTTLQTSPEATPAHRRERLGLEVGAVTLMSLGGVGPAVLPLMRVGWAARSWLVVQAALAGAGTHPTVATTGGKARVAQQYAVLGACYRLRPDRRLWPFFALAGGVLHTSAAGQTDVTTQGRTVDQWSLLLDGSLGAGLRLSRRTFLTLAAHGHVAQPYVAIHIADAVGATTGRPNLLLTLTLGVWL